MDFVASLSPQPLTVNKKDIRWYLLCHSDVAKMVVLVVEELVVMVLLNMRMMNLQVALILVLMVMVLLVMRLLDDEPRGCPAPGLGGLAGLTGHCAGCHVGSVSGSDFYGPSGAILFYVDCAGCGSAVGFSAVGCNTAG